MTYMTAGTSDLLHAAYNTLWGLADLMLLAVPVRKTAGMGEVFSKMEICSLLSCILDVPGEAPMKEDRIQPLWKWIFSSGSYAY